MKIIDKLLNDINTRIIIKNEFVYTFKYIQVTSLIRIQKYGCCDSLAICSKRGNPQIHTQYDLKIYFLIGVASSYANWEFIFQFRI